MLYLIFFFFALYYLFLLWVIAGVHIGYRAQRKEKKSTDPFISVIVPVRDEESNVPVLLSCLQDQTYANFEILFIDDHSSDTTFQLLKDAATTDVRIRVLSNPGQGKKAAITAGVDAAGGSIIVTTDADCVPQTGWLSEISKPYTEEDVKAVFGPVVIQSEGTYFNQLQVLEFTSVVAVGIAAHAFGRPLYCNGANFSYCKHVFEEVGGYEGNLDIPSGDDEHLLKKIHKRYPVGIRFLSEKDGLVCTSGQRALKSFLQQRIRWAAKWRATSDVFSRFLAVTVFIVQLSFLAAILLIFTGTGMPVLGYLFGGKMILEFVLFFIICGHLGIRVSLSAFFLLQLLYPIYVVYVAVMANFTTFEWKGRQWDSRTGVQV